MITYKSLTLEELKSGYINNHGFVFQSNQSSSDDSIKLLCDTLIKHNVTTQYPEFVARLNPNITIFVYGDDFDSPLFCKYSMLGNQLGICVTDTLNTFLNSQ
jgi:hypothetical protein